MDSQISYASPQDSATVGLSTCHNSTNRTANLAIWSNLAEFSEQSPNQIEVDPPIRTVGDINSFSPKSRNRLLRKLFRVNCPDKQLPIFITLTYPKNFPRSGKIWKEHVQAYIRQIKTDPICRKWVWKLEFQKRGAPHFHIIVYPSAPVGKNTLLELREFTARSWYKIVGSGDEKHFRAGTQVAQAHNRKQLVSYLSKYISKDTVPIEYAWVGRFWATSADFEDDPVIEIQLNDQQVVDARRLAKRYLKAQGKSYRKYAKLAHKRQNFSLFVPLHVMVRYVFQHDPELISWILPAHPT